MRDRPLTAREIPFTSQQKTKVAPVFTVESDGRYVLKAPDIGMIFEVDRLRWDRQELRGELTVRCSLLDVPVTDGVLTSGSFNLSYISARRDHARSLAGRANVPVVDVTAALDDICHRVLAAERTGHSATLLHTVAMPVADLVHDIDGIVLPQRHPSMLFGDGGCGKSYIALLILGVLAKRGHRTMYVDWELDAADHRLRLERLFGAAMPEIYYVRCDRPMSAEADRLRRLVAEHQIDFAVFDSVAFACDGPPESAEAAAGYFRAVRQLGPIGSLHLAHITKPGNDPAKGDKSEHKPFGSVFWNNSARACWFIKRAEAGTERQEGRVVVGLYHRKSNLGALRAAVGLELVFGEHTTSVTQTNLAAVSDLAKGLPIWRRIQAALASGPMTIEALAEEIDARPESITKAVKRMDLFTKVDASDGRKLIALVDRRVA